VKRWQIIAVYGCLGPLLGGVVVAAGVVISEPPPARFLLEFIATCLVFSIPFGLLAAIAAGVAHALLLPRAKPPILIACVCLVGFGFYAATVFMIGSPARLLESPASLLGFALPPIATAAMLSTVLLRYASPGT
jgi:hypothetical protein